MNANSAKWYAANIAHVKANVAVWKSTNPDKAKAITTAWVVTNKGRVKASNDLWCAANKDKRRVYKQTRRARISKVAGKLSPGLVGNLLVEQGGVCKCCNKPLGDDYHLDHRMPLALGGSNTDSNMQLLTAKCNRQKGAKHPDKFRQEIQEYS